MRPESQILNVLTSFFIFYCQKSYSTFSMKATFFSVTTKSDEYIHKRNFSATKYEEKRAYISYFIKLLCIIVIRMNYRMREAFLLLYATMLYTYTHVITRMIYKKDLLFMLVHIVCEKVSLWFKEGWMEFEICEILLI